MEKLVQILQGGKDRANQHFKLAIPKDFVNARVQMGGAIHT